MTAARRRSRGRTAILACVVAMAGCGRPAPPPPVDTGAKEAARAYFDGVIRKDWNVIYPALHPDSRRHYTREQFAQRSIANRKRMPFEPEVLLVRSCEEQGEKAIARVILTTRATRHKPRFTDAVVVRRSEGVWRVVLPDHFGR